MCEHKDQQAILRDRAHGVGTGHQGGLWAFLAVLCVGLVLGVTRLQAEQPAASAEVLGSPASVPPPLRFRRVFVPQDRLNEVRDPVPYFPLNAAEFEKMIAQANSQAVFRGQTGQVTAAIYRAVVRNDTLVGLEGEWTVQLPPRMPQAFVPLGSVNVALGDTVWGDVGGFPVSLFTDSRGELGLVVNRSGKIHFRWSARGQASLPEGTLKFDLRFPAAVQNELQLIMSDPWEVAAENALLLPIDVTGGELPGTRVIFKGDRPITLVLKKQDWQRKIAPAFTYREKIAYELTLHGVEAVWEWDLDVLDESVASLRFPVPVGMHLTEVRLGDTVIPWEIERVDDAGPGKIHLQLPEALRGTHRTLLVRGFQNLPLGRVVSLPSISLEGGFWLAGTATVVVREPLLLKDFHVQQAHLKQVMDLPGSPVELALEIVRHTPHAEIQVACDIQPPRVRSTAFINWWLEPGRVRADVDLAVEGRQATPFQLTFPVRGGWKVEEVNTPAEALLEDWRWEAPEKADGTGQFIVRLRKLLPADRQTVFHMVFSRGLSEDEPGPTLQELTPLEGSFLADGGEAYGVVRPDRSSSGNFYAELEPPVSSVPQAVIEGLRQWANLPAGATIFPLTEELEGRRVRLVPRAVRFSSHMTGLVTLSENRVQLRYELTVQPQQTAVERVPVLWTASPAGVTWRLQEEPKEASTSVLRTVAVAGGDSAASPLQDVLLAQPRRGSFTLVATLELPLQPGPIPLPIPVQAERFDATLWLVNGRKDEKPPAYRWTTRGLRFADEGPGSRSVPVPVLAAYRYEGGWGVGEAEIPHLQITDQKVESPERLWAIKGQVTYRWDGAGTLERWHVLSTVCPQGGQAVFYRPPGEDPTHMAVSLDGRWLPWEDFTEGTERGFRVKLPPQRTQALLVVWERFSEPGGPLAQVAVFRRLHPAFPVHRWQGSVWTPPGYRALVSDDLWDWGFHFSAWGGRLFGPLWRPADQPLFLPDQVNRMLFEPSAPPPNLAVRRAEQFIQTLGEHVAQLLNGVTPGERGSGEAAGQGSALLVGHAEAGGGSVRQGAPISLAWREVLSDALLDKVYNLPPSTRSVVFLADRRAFEELGITPLTSWQPPADLLGATDGSFREVGVQVLDSAGLVLVITPRAVVLTSLVELTRHRTGITWAKLPLFKLAPESAWRREIEEALVREKGEQYCRIRIWNDLPEPALPPEPLSAAEPELTLARQGWNATALPPENLQSRATAAALIVPADHVSGARWLLLLVVFLLSTLTIRQRRVLFLLAIAMALAVVFVPWPVAPAISGVFLGFVLAFVVSFLRRASGPQEAPQSVFSRVLAPSGAGPASARGDVSARSAGMAGAVVIGMAILAGVACAAIPGDSPRKLSLDEGAAMGEGSSPSDLPRAGRSFVGPLHSAQARDTAGPQARLVTLVESAPGVTAPVRPTAEGAASSADRPAFRVFIPVDDTGRPVGQEVYVPEEFYRELQRRVNPPPQMPSGWQFVSAVYRGTFSAGNVGDRWEITDFHLTLECLVAEASSTLDFPLGSDSLKPRVEEILLDGRPAGATWNAGRLQVPFTETGRHRLRIPFSLAPSARGSYLEVAGSVPRVANARVELAASPEFLRVEVPSAFGRVESDPESGAWTAELGPADQLVIRWPASQPPFAEVSTECERLCLLDIQPDGYHWTVRWRVRSADTALRQLQMICDGELMLQKVTGPGQVEVQPKGSAENRQIFELTFSAPLPEEWVLTAEFLQAPGEVPGGVKLPDVILTEMSLTRQALIVLRSPGLRLERDESPGWQVADLAQIIGRWNLPPVDAALAYESTRPSAFWGAWFVPEPSPLPVDETVQVTIGARAVDLIWQARSAKDRSSPGSYQVTLPPGFEVDRVAVFSGAVQHPCRIAFPQKGRLVVLTGMIPGGETRLVIEGTIPRAEGEEWTFARPQIDGVQTQSLTIGVFRESGVSVDVVEAAGVEPISLPAGALLQPADDLRVAAYASSTPETVKLRFRTRSRESMLEAKMAVHLWPEKSRWHVRAIWDLESDSPIVELPLEIPTNWLGPYTVVPEGTLRLVETAEKQPPDAGGESVASVSGTITFTKPLLGPTRIIVEGELSVGAGGRISIPVPRSPLVRPKSLHVVLPSSWAWDEKVARLWNLRPLSPSELEIWGLSGREWTGYEGSPVERWPVLKPHQVATPRMEGCEVVLALNPQGELLGWMEAQLVNAVPGDIVTEPIVGLKLAGAWLDGRSVPASMGPDGRWVIPVDEGPPTRVVELLFYREAGEGLSLPLPRFRQIEPPTQVFLWVQAPMGYEIVVPRGSEWNLREYELGRLRWTAEALGEAASAGVGGDFAAASRLARQFLWLRDRAQREIMLGTPGSGIGSAEVRLRNLEFQVTDYLQSMLGVEALSLSPGQATADAVISEAPEPPVQRRAFVCNGPPPEVIFRQEPARLPWESVLLGAVTVALGGGLAGLILGLWPRLTIWVMRFAHPTLVVVGLLWWLFLRPGFVGWLLILSAIALLIRSRWQWVPQEEAEVPLIVQQSAPPESRPR